MNQISKPHLVMLLRIFDQRKYFVPRIRYASVRSKPELLNDLYHYFGTSFDGQRVKFLKKSNVPRDVPSIEYDLKDRSFFFDGVPVKYRPESRPVFGVRRGPVTVRFEAY